MLHDDRVPLYVDERSPMGYSGSLQSADGRVVINLTCEAGSLPLPLVKEAGWYNKRTGETTVYEGFVGHLNIHYRAPNLTETIMDSTPRSHDEFGPEAEATERERAPGYRMPGYKSKSKYTRKKKVRVKNKHKH